MNGTTIKSISALALALGLALAPTDGATADDTSSHIVVAMAKRPPPLINPREIRLDEPPDVMGEDAGRGNAPDDYGRTRSIPVKPYKHEERPYAEKVEDKGPRGPELKEIYQDIDEFNMLNKDKDLKAVKKTKDEPSEAKETIKKLDPRRLKFW